MRRNIHKQILFLTESSRIKTRRTVQKLLDDTQKVFAAVEKDIQPLQAAYQAEMSVQ